LSSQLFAIELGKYSQTYPVTERSILELIHERLVAFKENGTLQTWEDDFKQTVKDHTVRPNPVKGLTITLDPEQRFFEPTFTLKSDVYDQNGLILYAKGTTVNPLDQSTWPAKMQKFKFNIKYDYELIFLDADDPKQLNWTKERMTKLTKGQQRFKIILINGNVVEAAKYLDHRVYFDQKAVLTKKFKLTHIPVSINQDKTHFVIQEYNVTHYSHKLTSEHLEHVS